MHVLEMELLCSKTFPVLEILIANVQSVLQIFSHLFLKGLNILSHGLLEPFIFNIDLFIPLFDEFHELVKGFGCGVVDVLQVILQTVEALFADGRVEVPEKLLQRFVGEIL